MNIEMSCTELELMARNLRDSGMFTVLEAEMVARQMIDEAMHVGESK